ncbi:MAG: ribosome biogenesis GTPase YlqF [Oscillospiraceae bacterium]
MSEASSVQWFPGHMAKTRRLMQSSLSLVDAVVEITDARIPQSSRNPEMDRLVGQKPRLILLNKCDTADDRITSMWLDFYKKKNIPALAADCRSGKGLNRFLPVLKELLSERIESWNARGMVGRPIRIMIVGIPNVGKSSFINKMAKSKRAKVEDRPGVTRGKQWVSLSAELEMLDMPGVLWPKFEDKLVGERLAFTGAVKDDIMDLEHLACRLLEFIGRNYPDRLTARYGVEIDKSTQGYELLKAIGRKRGFLISGGEVNTERAAITVLDEFRGGIIGRISLELPEK